MLYSKKNMGYWTYAGVDYNSPYLTVNSVVSYPPLLTRERGEVWKISPIGWAQLYLSANFQNTSTEKGEEGVTADLMSLNRLSWSIGNLMPELTSHCVAGFNSH